MQRYLLVLLCILAGLSASLLAQSEFELFVGGYNPGSELTETDFDNGALLGFRYGGSFLHFFGSEFSYTFVKDLEDQRQSFDGNAHLLSGNFLIQLPVGKAVPFATVGLGSIIGKSDNLLRIRKTFAVNVGGGLKIRKLAGPAGLRFDVRYYKVPDGVQFRTGDLRKADFDFAEVSAGLLLTF